MLFDGRIRTESVSENHQSQRSQAGCNGHVRAARVNLI